LGSAIALHSSATLIAAKSVPRPQLAGERPAMNRWLLWAGFAALILSTAHLLPSRRP
jgi:hypothetical protein